MYCSAFVTGKRAAFPSTPYTYMKYTTSQAYCCYHARYNNNKPSPHVREREREMWRERKTEKKNYWLYFCLINLINELKRCFAIRCLYHQFVFKWSNVLYNAIDVKVLPIEREKKKKHFLIKKIEIGIMMTKECIHFFCFVAQFSCIYFYIFFVIVLFASLLPSIWEF